MRHELYLLYVILIKASRRVKREILKILVLLIEAQGAPTTAILHGARKRVPGEQVQFALSEGVPPQVLEEGAQLAGHSARTADLLAPQETLQPGPRSACQLHRGLAGAQAGQYCPA